MSHESSFESLMTHDSAADQPGVAAGRLAGVP